MTEPQLSAEQKKEWVVKTITKWMSESQEGMAIHVLSNYVNERIATALEEQRSKDLSFLKEMREYAGTPTDLVKWEMVTKMIDDWIAELNQLKEEV